MQIQPVLFLSLLFICNIYGLDLDEKPSNRTITQCILAPVLLCTKNDSNFCVGPKLLLISSPLHGNLTFELESITSKNYLMKANSTDCIFTGKMNGTSNQVSVNTCSHSLNNSNLVICLRISIDSWSIGFNKTKECYQIQLSQCSIQEIIPIDTFNRLKPENILIYDSSFNHLFDPKFLISTPRYVEIGIAFDCTTIKSTFPNYFIINLFKKATQLLTQMNIFAILSVIHKLDTTDMCDEAKMHRDDTKMLLNTFKDYIKENHNKLAKYDVIIRFTGTCSDCRQIGLASLYQACNSMSGHAVVRDNNDYVVAATFAHELLHTFGVYHDDDEDVKVKVVCPYEHCLMFSTLPYGQPALGLSMFTIQQVEAYILLGYLDCFLDKPEERLHKYCGDYALNNNEQCDCLDVKHCSNCCNTSTCLLLKGAKCGHGPCCNFETCELYKSTDDHVCRPATSDCDIEEKCDGLSASCPPDLHMHDGLSCEYGQGHCFNGKCGSYHLSCDKIYANSDPGPDSCYEKNTLGSTFLNCGPPLQYFQNYEDKPKKCKKEDVKCGRLQCVTSSKLRDAIAQKHLNVIIDFQNEICRGIYISRIYQRNATDLGLAPDGAPCAPNKMCVNQECIPLSEVIQIKPCPLNCQNRGKCTNQGTCLCNYHKDKSPDCSFSPVTSPNWQALLRYFETTIQLIVVVVTTSTWIVIQLNK